MSDDDGDIPPTLHELVAELGAAAAVNGFDLCAHTTVAAYHRALGTRDDSAFRLPDYLSPREVDGAPASRAVILLGNTRALWPRFMEALERDPPRRDTPHPLDQWTSQVITRLVVSIVGPHYAFDVRFVFEGGVRAFSALHLAEAAGLAWRGPAGLAVHPLHGPWFALRAAVVVDLPGREAAPPDALCERCREKPCLVALARAQGADRPAEHAALRERWRDWLAVREACPVAPDARFGDAQIRWHYAHDRSALGE